MEIPEFVSTTKYDLRPLSKKIDNLDPITARDIFNTRVPLVIIGDNWHDIVAKHVKNIMDVKFDNCRPMFEDVIFRLKDRKIHVRSREIELGTLTLRHKFNKHTEGVNVNHEIACALLAIDIGLAALTPNVYNYVYRGFSGEPVPDQEKDRYNIYTISPIATEVKKKARDVVPGQVISIDGVSCWRKTAFAM